MKKQTIFLTLFIAFAISFWSCQQSQMPVESNTSNVTTLQKTFASATLRINVEHIAFNHAGYLNYDLKIQKLSTDWEEMSATWISPWTTPGGDYVAPIVSHLVDDTFPLGMTEFDITALWTGGVPPYGIILRVENAAGEDKRIKFTSKEGGITPEVVVTYTDAPDDTLLCIGDTWISNIGDYDNLNFGDQLILYVGNASMEAEKRTLLKFEVPPPTSCETAYGWLDERSTCFMDAGFKNWGWTTGLLSPDTYEFEIWAAAGQCDKDKGTYVGTATVEYDGSTVNVTYNLEDGFTIDESHVYAGTSQFPLNKKGNPTVAPGQYYIQDGLAGQDIYIIVHAVVCGDYDMD